MIIGCVNQPFKNYNCGHQFFFHVVNDIAKVGPVDGQVAAQGVADFVNLFIRVLKVLLFMKFGNVNKLVEFFSLWWQY